MKIKAVFIISVGLLHTIGNTVSVTFAPDEIKTYLAKAGFAHIATMIVSEEEYRATQTPNKKHLFVFPTAYTNTPIESTQMARWLSRVLLCYTEKYPDHAETIKALTPWVFEVVFQGYPDALEKLKKRDIWSLRGTD